MRQNIDNSFARFVSIKTLAAARLRRVRYPAMPGYPRTESQDRGAERKASMVALLMLLGAAGLGLAAALARPEPVIWLMGLALGLLAAVCLGAWALVQHKEGRGAMIDPGLHQGIAAKPVSRTPRSCGLLVWTREGERR